ncbi:MAG: GntR family transcriptional regulator [Deltaproteobacteria bacterium]|nr:GntR family transcriptional regulator [Deltaproteobacteria bacterium]
MAGTNKNKNKAYQIIRDGIISGTIRAGESVTEKWFCDYAGGMSRTPIREALIQLQGENLITIIDNKGVIINEISPLDIKEIFQLRMLIEPFIASDSVDSIDRDKVQKYKDQLDTVLQYEDPLEGMTECGMVSEDLNAIHSIIYSASANGRIIHILRNLQSQIMWVIKRVERVPGRVLKTISEHREIADAILKGNGKLAGRKMKAHLESTMNDMLNHNNYSKIF